MFMCYGWTNLLQVWITNRWSDFTRRRFSVLALVFAAMLLLGRVQTAYAQEFAGHVGDATGAAIPKATVTVTNDDTAVSVKTVTTGSGDYNVPYLRPGTYTVGVEADGFTRELKSRIILQVGQTAVINFNLKVGSVSETVTVNV